MPAAPTRLAACALALLLAPGLLAACGGESEGSSDVTGAVKVTSTNDACTPETTSFAPGKVKLAVENKGSAATELYVYDGEKVLAEVENVGPGTSRSISAELKAGGTAYAIACKPGGKTIKVPISVTA